MTEILRFHLQQFYNWRALQFEFLLQPSVATKQISPGAVSLFLHCWFHGVTVPEDQLDSVIPSPAASHSSRSLFFTPRRLTHLNSLHFGQLKCWDLLSDSCPGGIVCRHLHLPAFAFCFRCAWLQEGVFQPRTERPLPAGLSLTLVEVSAIHPSSQPDLLLSTTICGRKPFVFLFLRIAVK